MTIEQNILEVIVKGFASLDKLGAKLDSISSKFDNLTSSMSKTSKAKNLNPKYIQSIKEAEKSGTKFSETLTTQSGEATKLSQTLTEVAAKEDIYKTKKVELTSAGDKLVQATKKQAGAASVYSTETIKAAKNTTATRDSVISLTKEGYKLTTVTTTAANGQKTIATSLDKTKNALAKGESALTSYVKSWSFLSRVIAGSLIARGIGQITSALSTAVKQANEFQIRVSELRTISQENQLSFGSWSQAVRDLSDEFARNPIDVLEGTYQALSNQIAEGAQVTQFMREALRLSIITTSTTEEAVLGLTGSLNAYKASAEDAREFSDKLFKTVELGRIRFKELSGSIGQVLIVSKQLGVSSDEILGALSTLTIQGLNATNAQTALRNVLLKLVRPTDAMKALFQEWGVASGEAAIQTFGFVGTIDKLSQAAKRGNSDLSELGEFFGRIRAITGAAGLTGSLDLLSSNIDKIKNSTESANKAFKIATESAAFKLNKELTKIQNNFLKLGEKFIDTVANISDNFIKLSTAVNTTVNAIEKLIEVGIIAGLTYGATRLGLTLVTVAKGFQLATKAAVGFAAANAAASGTGILAAISAAPPAAVAAVFAALGYFITKTFFQLRDESSLTYDQIADGYREEMIAAQLDVTANYNRELKKQLDSSLTTYQQIATDFSQKIAKQQRDLNKIVSSQKIRDLSESVNAQILEKFGSRRVKQEALYQNLLKTRLDIIKALKEQDEEAVNSSLQKLFELNDAYKATQKNLSKTQLRREKNLNFQQSLGIPVERTPAEFNRANAPNFQKTFKDTLNKILEANNKVIKSIPKVNQTVIEGQQKSIDLEREREKNIRASIKAIDDLGTAINKLVSDSGELTGSFKASFAELEKQLNSKLLSQPFKNFGAAEKTNEINDLKEKLKQLSDQILNNPFEQEPGFIPNAAYFEAKQRDLDALLAKIRQISPEIVDDSKIKAQIDSVQAKLNVLLNQQNALDRSRDQLQRLNDGVGASQQAINNLTTELESYASAGTLANREITEFINLTAIAQENLLLKIQSSTRAFEAQIAILNQLRQIPIPTPGEVQSNYTGGYISRFASGGSVGSDSINAKLSPGEFVLNKTSARQYFAQATALNSRAARFDNGGIVNNNSNIGDININLSGSGKTETDARVIAQAVRREIKRGTIRLN